MIVLTAYLEGTRNTSSPVSMNLILFLMNKDFAFYRLPNIRKFDTIHTGI
jgi:hypothetical protein